MRHNSRELLTALLIAASTVSIAAEPSKPAAKNLALGAKYKLWPAPNYQHCTDPGDAVQLTDGKTTADYFWTQQGTVGWSGAPYATVTVDLGRVEPIAGVSFNSAAGVAGVLWPSAIRILVSDDGASFRDMDDLVALDVKAHGPLPQGYALRRLTTHELHTKGRFVCFMVIPLSGCPFIFVDEVQVFRGPEALLKGEPGGRPVRDVAQLFEEGRIQRAVDHRLQSDVAALRRTIHEAKHPDGSARTMLLDRIWGVQKGAQTEKVALDRSFRAVLPLTKAHADLFQVQADLWRQSGFGALSACIPRTWDPVELFGMPTRSQPAVQVHAMRGEYRAGAVNLFNSSDRPLEVRVSFEGLPASPSPGYLTVHEVAWTDTSLGEPVAAALPEARRAQDAWTLTVLPGLVRQVWLTFHVTDLAPGEYAGKIVIQSAGQETLRVPVALRVWPLEFPKQTTLLVGGWSYTDGAGCYGVNLENRKQFLEHLQSRFVNAPWASGAVLLNCRLAGSPATVQLDTQRMDDWLAQWPNARQYMVFLAAGPTFLDAKIGTPDFDRRVAAWISAWVRHLGAKGISPERLCLLVHDEPSEGTDIAALVAWAKAIRAAEPKVRIWEDPTYLDPAKAPSEVFEVSHILCPNRPMWLERGKPFEQFYLDQQRRGRTLNFYSCSGPAKLLDPYSYWRLQAWHCWQVNGSGSFFWAFGDNSGSSSWNEYLAVAGPFTPLFLDDKTVVAGKQMEAVRESVEDYEYFVMLRQAVDRAKAAGRSDATLAKAEAILAGGAQRVLALPGVEKIFWRDNKDRSLADAVRVELLEALVSLK